MKNSLLILISALILSACSTTKNTSTIVVPMAKPIDINKTAYVLSEICTIPSKSTLSVISTDRSGAVISSNSQQVQLSATTMDNFNIFSVLLEKPSDLTYLAVENFIHPTTYFLFKRNFINYKLNEWSQWESPDYLFKEGSDLKFFWLSTREIDRTNELLKIQYKNQETIKARFKLTLFEDYLKTVQPSKDTVLVKKNVERCV